MSLSYTHSCSCLSSADEEDEGEKGAGKIGMSVYKVEKETALPRKKSMVPELKINGVQDKG